MVSVPLSPRARLPFARLTLTLPSPPSIACPQTWTLWEPSSCVFSVLHCGIVPHIAPAPLRARQLTD